jgi:hypothetical protein
MWQWKWIAQRLPKSYASGGPHPPVTTKASKVIAQELMNYLPEYQSRLRKDNKVVDTNDVKKNIQELPEYYKFIKYVEKRRWKLQERQHRS